MLTDAPEGKALKARVKMFEPSVIVAYTLLYCLYTFPGQKFIFDTGIKPYKKTVYIHLHIYRTHGTHILN